MLSKHANDRAKQRSIPPMIVDLLLDFGCSESAGDGTSRHFFDKRSRQRIRAYAGPLASVMEQHLSCYLVIGEGGTIVTVGHRTNRFK